MPTTSLENKRIFLIASGDPLLIENVQAIVTKTVQLAKIYTASDVKEALFKADNSFPHVAIVDAALPKGDGFEVVEEWIKVKEDREHKVSVILLTDIPDKEHFVDQVITGEVQFLTHKDVPEKLSNCIIKGLNRITVDDQSAYRLKFLPAKEFLFHQDEEAKNVYLVRKGELVALKKTGSQPVVLGKIGAGEFVGEMAHINNENRSASVQAVTDCELIEISRDSLDTILMAKPAWAKALIATLSKRLKSTISRAK